MSEVKDKTILEIKGDVDIIEREQKDEKDEKDENEELEAYVRENEEKLKRVANHGDGYPKYMAQALLIKGKGGEKVWE